MSVLAPMNLDIFATIVVNGSAPLQDISVVRNCLLLQHQLVSIAFTSMSGNSQWMGVNEHGAWQTKSQVRMTTSDTFSHSSAGTRGGAPHQALEDELNNRLFTIATSARLTDAGSNGLPRRRPASRAPTFRQGGRRAAKDSRSREIGHHLDVDWQHREIAQCRRSARRI